MKPFVTWYAQICLISAVVALAVQNFAISRLAALRLPDRLGQAVPFLTATAAYMLLYKFLIWLYERWGWKKLLKKYDISGTWYQEYLSPSKPSYVRHGVTIIDQGIWHVTFNGRNYDPSLDPKSMTLWNSTAAALEEDGRLVVAYVAHRCGEPSREDPLVEKTGLLLVTIIKDKKGRPCRMKGIFEDTSPSNLRGSITWWRKTEWSGLLEKKEL